MRTKMPRDLVPGDRLATYAGERPARPLIVMKVARTSPSSTHVLIITTEGNIEADASLPVEVL